MFFGLRIQIKGEAPRRVTFDRIAAAAGRVMQVSTQMPDEVTGLVLKDLDTHTRLQAHQACAAWNRLPTRTYTRDTWQALVESFSPSDHA